MIKDINETTASISLEYEIMAANDEGKAEYYNVTDFLQNALYGNTYYAS